MNDEDERCARAGLVKISVGSSFLARDWLNDEADYEAPRGSLPADIEP
jgi:hypothetical protein